MKTNKDSMIEIIEMLSFSMKQKQEGSSSRELINQLKNKCNIVFDQDFDLNVMTKYQPIITDYLSKLNKIRDFLSAKFIQFQLIKDDNSYYKQMYNDVLFTLEVTEEMSLLLRGRLVEVCNENYVS